MHDAIAAAEASSLKHMERVKEEARRGDSGKEGVESQVSKALAGFRFWHLHLH